MTKPAMEFANPQGGFWGLLFLLRLGNPSIGLSFCFFRIVRRLLRRMAGNHLRKHPHLSTTWRPLSAEFFAKRGALLAIMTTGPRWNPHAFIATTGPLMVRETLHFQAEVAKASAPQWFFVVYSYPEHETVGSVSSLNTSGKKWEIFKPSCPGRYVIAGRYFYPTDSAAFPPLRVDGVDAVSAVSVPPDLNSYYAGLRDNESLLYLLLSYYVYPMLRNSDRLPHSFVESEYLPVGNPECQFSYGALKKGSRLRIQIEPELFDTSAFFVTIYSRYSFPISWFEVKLGDDSLTPAVQVDGFYLVRILQKGPSEGSLEKGDSRFAVTVEEPSKDAADSTS